MSGRVREVKPHPASIAAAKRRIARRLEEVGDVAAALVLSEEGEELLRECGCRCEAGLLVVKARWWQLSRRGAFADEGIARAFESWMDVVMLELSSGCEVVGHSEMVWESARERGAVGPLPRLRGLARAQDDVRVLEGEIRVWERTLRVVEALRDGRFVFGMSRAECESFVSPASDCADWVFEYGD